MVIPATATAIGTRDSCVCSISTDRAGTLDVRAAILTAGTFLDGLIRVGEKAIPAGRAGDAPSVELAENLKQLGLKRLRFKTGTPARIDRNSVDFEAMTEQPGDDPFYRFSHFFTCESLPQVSCWHTHTSARTRSLVLDNLKKSSLYGGFVEGTGPRYCPSIEDKFVRFGERDRHHLFLEPEGLDTDEMYLNGLSNSLPLDIQVELVHSVEGLENARIIRPGYAIEYDCYDPTDLYHTLECRSVHGLYLAGQVNGTSGYEEAAGQGLAAGLNAALALQDKEPVTFSRSDSYLGVMIDDIVTQGVDEPYRLFSSRAESRLSLRQDNADIRLSPLAHRLGLITDSQYEQVRVKVTKSAGLIDLCRRTRISPDRINPLFRRVSSAETSESFTVDKILRRPEIRVADLFSFLGEDFAGYPDDILAQVEMEIKYEGYMIRERSRHEQTVKLERKKIPADFDYSAVNSISTESRQRLSKNRPDSLGAASRIPGLRPDDITALMVELSRRKSE